MNSSSDAAESIVRMSLQGTDYALRITGSLTKNVIAGLYALSKDRKQTKGKTTLNKMLKSGKELKVFSIKTEDLKLFQQEAKRYGVLFTALIDKNNKNFDGMVDIMTRAEDASKINRIVKRFKLSSYDEATIKNEITKTRNDKEAKDMGMEIKSVEDKLVDDILSKPTQKEENEISNPQTAKMEKSPLSEHSSTNKNKSEVGTNSKDKPSVREEIKNIKEEQKQKTELEKSDIKKDTPNKESKHEQPKNKKKRKEKVK